MRTFDYRHLPQSLFDGTVGNANVRAYEDKGKLEALEQLRAPMIDTLRAQAHLESVRASAHIEGLYEEAGRAHAVLAGADPTNEVEHQMAGYSRALQMVRDETDGLELETGSIVRLYETLYEHRHLGRKSRYRKKDYLYMQIDGRPQAMPVSPITAFETPLVLGGACDSLADAFSARACSPLILNAVFTVDFLCIRPFDEGNGRIARLFAELMLRKAGFRIGDYVSVDRIIEDSAMEYYDALNACVEGWDQGKNDYAPYAAYWLSVIHQAHEVLFDQVERLGSDAQGKSDRVKSYVLQANEPVAKRQLREAFPDISEATIENALAQLVRERAVEKIGAGRATAYRPRR